MFLVWKGNNWDRRVGTVYCFLDRLEECKDGRIAELQLLLETSQRESRDTAEVNRELEQVLQQQTEAMTRQAEELQGAVEERDMTIAELNAQAASLKLEHEAQVEDLQAAHRK